MKHPFKDRGLRRRVELLEKNAADDRSASKYYDIYYGTIHHYGAYPAGFWARESTSLKKVRFTYEMADAIGKAHEKWERERDEWFKSMSPPPCGSEGEPDS